MRRRNAQKNREAQKRYYYKHRHERKLHERLKFAEWWRKNGARWNEHRRELTFRWREHRSIEEKEILMLLGENWGGTVVNKKDLQHPCYKFFLHGNITWEDL
ncbi:MAG: hypothetical protein ACYC92_03760 [Candidatus Acidiferrales bacterium]